MIEDMNDKDILDKARMEGMNQGIWLAVQELAYDGRWTQAAEELVSSCGLTEDECRKLQEESGSFDDEMLEFIDTIFSRKIDLDENNQRISVNISTMKVGDTYSFADNHVVLMEKDFEYTILMDEPDRNLDIDNIMDLYKVLSFHKPQTQIIAVIHNPALIYKLSKLDCVNFIEMTRGYLNKVVDFMNK